MTQGNSPLRIPSRILPTFIVPGFIYHLFRIVLTYFLQADVLKELKEASPVYVAEYEGEIVSFLWIAVSQSTAFELYGGVTDTGQSVRANYCLKWQAIRDLKAKGISEYDLNGLLNDGISSFKLGFSDGEETMLAGTFDKPLSPLYTVWRYALPIAKKVARVVKR